MGADLTIEKAENPRGMFEVSEEAVESGYFRDCYNSYGLFAVASATSGKTYSWWQWQENNKDVIESDDEAGTVLTLEGVKRLQQTAQEVLEIVENQPLKKTEGFGEDRKRVPLEDDKDEYIKWAKGLVRLCEKALQMDSRIHWSV